MFKPSSEVSHKILTFTKGDINKQIKADLEKQGYGVKSVAWNEASTKVEVHAVTKPASKPGI